MATTFNAATFVGKNFSTIQSVVKNSEDLTLKQMFDVTAQLLNNHDEINGVDKILWGKDSWTPLYLLEFCVVPRKGSSTSRIQRSLEEQEPDPIKATEMKMLSMESQLNSSGIFSQDSRRSSSVIKSVIY